jgi:hypothetical protein
MLAVAALALSAAAQVGNRLDGGNPASTPAASVPVRAPAPGDVTPIVAQIQATARSTTTDISQLNIRKWKVGADIKSDAETKADSIQRNLRAALPAMISQVQRVPNDFSGNFKLYRNLGVLYDVMSSLAESAGAFGSKSEFENLAADLNRMDQARHALGERLETLANAKEAEITWLQNQLRAERTAAAAPPKKIVVDENDNNDKKPAAKNARKKKPTTLPQTNPQ